MNGCTNAYFFKYTPRGIFPENLSLINSVVLEELGYDQTIRQTDIQSLQRRKDLYFELKTAFIMKGHHIMLKALGSISSKYSMKTTQKSCNIDGIIH